MRLPRTFPPVCYIHNMRYTLGNYSAQFRIKFLMDNGFETFDERFTALLLPDSKLEKLHTGTIWAEGPCYLAEGDYLIWSDIPNNRILRWSEAEGVSIFRQPSHY